MKKSNGKYQLASYDIFQINSWIYQGAYPSKTAEEELLRLGVTGKLSLLSLPILARR